MKTEFTKGEWTYFLNEKGSFTIVSNLGKQDEEILGIAFPPEVEKDTLDITQAEGNARLWTAAPDLLDTLIRLYEYVNGRFEIPINHVKQVRDVIKKATE